MKKRIYNIIETEFSSVPNISFLYIYKLKSVCYLAISIAFLVLSSSATTFVVLS